MGGGSSVINNQSQHLELHLKSYPAECERDRHLRQLDSGLQESTGRVIRALNEDVKAGGDLSLSLKSVKEIIGFFVQINVGLAEYILKFKEDISILNEIVKGYFHNSKLILDVFTALKECIARARVDHLIIGDALKKLQKFETEERESGLKLLEIFRAAGNPFTEEFFSSLKCVHENQESMLQNLKESKLDEELNKVSTWRTVSTVLFAVTSAALLIGTAVAAPLVVGGLYGAAATLGIVPMGVGAAAGTVWIDQLWKSHENELRAQGEIVHSLEWCYSIGKTEFKKIESDVDDLKKEMESVLVNDNDAVRQTMDRIWTELNGFMESIEKLSEHAAKCEHDVNDGMDKINEIIKYRN